MKRPVKKKNAAKSSWYHVTTLSNFVRGYDKYSGHYSKANIPQSTFPEQFFLLSAAELPIGIAKAEKLLDKLNFKGDRLIALQTSVAEKDLHRDHASGLGQYLRQNYIALDRVHTIDHDENGLPRLTPAQIEDMAAQSFAILNPVLIPWDQLKPRTVSVLPIAMACQASCRFCFSKASVSSDFKGYISNWDRITQTVNAAKQAGAERAVITGGGEPTLLKTDHMTQLIGICARAFNKVVLITNAHRLATKLRQQQLKILKDWNDAGLNILAISRHHHDRNKNTAIMGLDTKTEQLTATLQDHKETLDLITPRLICVLQKGGIENAEDIGAYLSWAAQQGIHQVNFKELYVSTGLESAYSSNAANTYSAQNQVPLHIVHDFARAHNWQKIAELPWGAPIYKGSWDGNDMQIAAYTEPSVYWERTHGIARSWNLMQNGTVLASLEDPNSKVEPQWTGTHLKR